MIRHEDARRRFAAELRRAMTPLFEASVKAEMLRAALEPACDRIAVAGSIRRRRPEVKDIEIVAVPHIDTVPAGLWGDPEPVDRLAERIGVMLADPGTTLRLRDVEVLRANGTVEHQRRDGDAYKALEYQGVAVDLFIVRPPADWGVLFAIRTGPADYSRRLVTDCQRRFMRVDGGRLLRHGEHVSCPEERDFLAALGEPWRDPWDRA